MDDQVKTPTLVASLMGLALTTLAGCTPPQEQSQTESDDAAVQLKQVFDVRAYYTDLSAVGM